MTLFETETIKTTCLTCKHRERHDINGKVFQYCGVRGSGRTSNGKLKIKCENASCGQYQKQ